VRDEVARISADGPLFVCGLSMGALLALLLAADLPSRLSGVAAISPTLFYDGWNIPWYRKFITAAYAWPLRYVLYWKEDPPYGIKDATMRRFIERQYREGGFHDTERARKYGYPYFPLSLLHQLSLLVRHITPRLGRIRVPVQVIQALEDDMTSIRNAQYIFDAVGSRMKELAVFGESYHVIPADRERETVAAKIAAFFDACGGCGKEREAVLHG
jgi:carboxylesterase